MKENQKSTDESVMSTDLVKEDVSMALMRMKTSEARVEHAMRECAEITHTVSDLMTTRIEPIYALVQDLEVRKADLHLLAAKADITDLEEFVSSTDLDAIKTDVEELNRHVAKVSEEVTNLSDNIDTSMETKSEKIAMWCLKVLKKEMMKRGSSSSGGGGIGGGGGAGGNIGRVKCLVCDQDTDQPIEAANLMFGAQMKNNMSPKHNILPKHQVVYALEKEKEREAQERTTGRPNSPIYGDRR
jgi:hypothetical protein